MQVFGFDLLAYPEHLDHLKQDGELPFPLPKQHFAPEVAVKNYEEHLDAWSLMDELGFDGVGFNEHHGSPYGLMTSPNIMAAAASQRIKKAKILIYGNLLPIHEPAAVGGRTLYAGLPQRWASHLRLRAGNSPRAHGLQRGSRRVAGTL